MMSAADALAFIEEHGVVLGRLKRRFTRQQLAQIHQEHTPSGKHINRVVEFPAWVPESVLAASRRMGDEEAERILAPVLACGEPH
jgi:hypothetical protein